MNATRIASVLMACVVLALTTCLVASCQPVRSSNPATLEARQALQDLNQQIELLDMLNRLDLTAKQIQSVQAIVAKIQADLTKIDGQRQAAIAELIPLLRDKKTALLQDKDASADIEKKIRDTQAKLDELDDQQQSALTKYGTEFRASLSAAQIDILTGADQAKTQAEELLTWIRGLSDADFAEEGKSNAAELAEPGLELGTGAIMKVFTDIRKMSEAEWTKNKAAVIGKMAPLFMPLKEAADDAVVGFFAAPQMPGLLQERAVAMGNK